MTLTRQVFTADGGVVEQTLTPEEEAAVQASWATNAAAASAATTAQRPGQVDDERDRRIALPLTINLANPVRTFQVNMDSDALRNMSGLATSAVLAKVLNVTTATSFIAYDNSIVQLSPDDLIALGQQVQAQISKLTFDGRVLKNMTPIPTDFTSDGYWQ